MKTDKLGRQIHQNPGGGKFYVLVNGKKIYKINKVPEHNNHQDMYTVEQLKAILTRRGKTGLSKYSKADLWNMAKPKPKNVIYVYTNANRFKTFSKIISS